MVAGTMVVALIFNLWFDGPDAQLAGSTHWWRPRLR